MSSPFNYFDRIYCINLDSRPDRLQETENEFNMLGIDAYERIPGVVASSGKFGCSKAIANTIEKALAENYKTVLICEDDIYFPKGKEHAHT